MAERICAIVVSFVVGGCGGARAVEQRTFGVTSGPEPVPSRLVVAPSTNTYLRNSEGTILTLRDGSLLLAWSAFFGGTEDGAAARILATRSRDGGQTWAAPVVLHEQPGLNVMCPSFVRLDNGDVLLVYATKLDANTIIMTCRRSVDDATTWGPEIPINTDMPGYVFAENDRGIQLRSGRVLVPEAACVGPGAEHCFSLVHMSDDGGLTWRRSITILDAPARGAMEPDVVELGDGRILMLLRTQLGNVWKSISGDGGITWSSPVPTALVSPEAPCKVRTVPGTGDLVVVYNNNTAGIRRPLSTAISGDGGETWNHFQDLETDERYAYSYPSVAFAGDALVLTYYQEDDGNRDSLVVRSGAIASLYR